MEMLQFMAAPLVACALLAGITAYLGIHIITRGVIFVDIALAQMAALGAAVALIFDYETNSVAGIVLSLLFTFGGALLIAWVRRLESNVPAEAFIGVLYVVGASLVILIMDRAPHGAEHIKELLVGQILWVNWSEVLRGAVVFAAVGLAFFLFHDKLYSITQKPETAREHPKQVFAYDMLFYALFGIVVTFSVRVAGVLLVFTYLVVPAMIASLLSRTGFLMKLLICWCVGLLISVIGISASYFFDLPTGASIVAGAGILLFISSIYKRWKISSLQ